MKKTSLVAVAMGFGLMAAAVAGPAQAADSNPGSSTTLAGVGSDTTDKVVGGFADELRDGSNNPFISNYEAGQTGTFTTRTGVATCTDLTRVSFNGSGNGQNRLSDAISGRAGGGSTNLAGCVDFARSSSGSNPSTPPAADAGGFQQTLTYIPFAQDSVTYATLTNTSVPKNLTLNELKDIYSRNTGNCLYEPLQPQAGSGTLSFWITTVLGFTSTTIGASGGPGTCVKNVNVAGVSIQEHDGRVLTKNTQLVPFSVAQYISQAAGVAQDQRGRSALATIDWTNTAGAGAITPWVLRADFGNGDRPVYNVVSTNAIKSGHPTFNQKLVDAFVGPTSLVCAPAGDAVVEKYGFGVSTICGDTTKKNTNSPGTVVP